MESNKEKFRRILFNLADSGQFIPGIYNYCDRWCERCPLCHKCLTYAHEQEMMTAWCNPHTNEFDNDKFYEQIRLSFEVALDIINEDAKRIGIDLDDLPEVEVTEGMGNPIEEMSGNYGSAIARWLEDNQDILEAKIYVHHRKNRESKFADAVEVLKWYCFYIEAKIRRSFFELDIRIQKESDESDLLADNRGSAKVAIIAINRSMEALTILYAEMKEQEDEILSFLALLSAIKDQMLSVFPTAMDFKRPGFDD